MNCKTYTWKIPIFSYILFIFCRDVKHSLIKSRYEIKIDFCSFFSMFIEIDKLQNKRPFYLQNLQCYESVSSWKYFYIVFRNNIIGDNGLLAGVPECLNERIGWFLTRKMIEPHLFCFTHKDDTQENNLIFIRFSSKNSYPAACNGWIK